jgi:hypothetical protein
MFKNDAIITVMAGYGPRLPSQISLDWGLASYLGTNVDSQALCKQLT